MKRSTFSVLFFIRRTRLLKDAKVPIYLRITVDGERAEVSIKKSIDPALWEDSKGHAKGNTQNSKKINYYLEQVRNQIFDYQQELKEKGKPVTASSLKKVLLKGEDEENRTLLKTYKEHNSDLKARIDKGVSKASLKEREKGRKNILV